MPRYQVEGEEQSDDHSTQQKSYLCDSGMTVMYLVETEKVKVQIIVYKSYDHESVAAPVCSSKGQLGTCTVYSSKFLGSKPL